MISMAIDTVFIRMDDSRMGLLKNISKRDDDCLYMADPMRDFNKEY